MEQERYIIENLDKAIAEKHIKVYYQPEVRVLSNKVCGMESLTRWDDPKLGFLSPNDFIPLLERHHLIHKLDIYAIEQVCQDIVHTAATQKTVIPISVNLSRLDFLLCDIYNVVVGLADKYNIDHSLLHLEVTESALNDELYHLHATVKRFRDAGFEVWLDDFGSEYSTLNSLQNYDFDVLKIDMKFFASFATNEASKTIISSVVDMAKRLHMRTVAEGIETKEELEFLRELGCDKAQGYYLYMPATLEELYRSIKIVEDNEEKLYFDKIGTINLLNPRPLSNNKIDDPMYFIVPTAIIEWRNNRFNYIFHNKSYLNCLISMGIPSIEASNDWINDDTYKVRTRLLSLAGRASAECTFKELDMVINGFNVNLKVKEVAKTDSYSAYYVTMYNLASLNNVKKLDDLETSLNFLYTIYNRVDLLDISADVASNVYMSATYYRSDQRREDVATSIERFVVTDIYIEDRMRFLEFYDFTTVEERMKKAGKDYLVQLMRTRNAKDEFVWQFFIIINVSTDLNRRYLSCIRDMDTTLADSFMKSYHTSKDR